VIALVVGFIAGFFADGGVLDTIRGEPFGSAS
jgi:hypothetical protein